MKPFSKPGTESAHDILRQREHPLDVFFSPQNVAVGVTTVGLIGKEGDIVRATFWHSILMATLLSALSFAQAYWLKWMIP